MYPSRRSPVRGMRAAGVLLSARRDTEKVTASNPAGRAAQVKLEPGSQTTAARDTDVRQPRYLDKFTQVLTICIRRVKLKVTSDFPSPRFIFIRLRLSYFER